MYKFHATSLVGIDQRHITIDMEGNFSGFVDLWYKEFFYLKVESPKLKNILRFAFSSTKPSSIKLLYKTFSLEGGQSHLQNLTGTFPETKYCIMGKS